MGAGVGAAAMLAEVIGFAVGAGAAVGLGVGVVVTVNPPKFVVELTSDDGKYCQIGSPSSSSPI